MTREGKGETLTSQREERDRVMLRLVAAIRRNPGANWSTAWVAKVLGVSPGYAVILFTRANGMSPMDFVRNERMREAMKLIDAGMPLALIGQHVGYASLVTFSRAFHKYVGVPASEYRRREKGTDD